MKKILLSGIVVIGLIAGFSGCASSGPKQLSFKEKYGVDIKDINTLPEETQITIVKDYGGNVRHIKNPSEKVQLAAVRNPSFLANGIDGIKNPSEKIQLEAINYVDNVKELLRGIKNPTVKVIITAIKKGGNNVLTYVKNPSKEVLEFLLEEDPSSLKYFKNISEDFQFKMIKQSPDNLRYIVYPTEKIKLLAIEQNPELIKYEVYPNEKIQLTALKKDPKLINYINNPTLKAKIIGYGKIETSLVHPKFVSSNKYLKLNVKGKELKITNLSNKFIKIKSIAEYFGKNVNNLSPVNIPPNTVITLDLFDNRKHIVSSINQTLQYGFAVEYKLSNSSRINDFYKTKKYKILDLIN